MLHWSKVPPAALGDGSSVWKQLPEAPGVDAAMIQRLFAVKTSAMWRKAAEDAPKTPRKEEAAAKVTFLELKRINQIGIAMAKFKLSNAQVLVLLLIPSAPF